MANPVARFAVTAASDSVAAYVPPSVDPVQQLIVIATVGLCVGYYLFIDATAQVKFNLKDKEKRTSIKKLMADESRPLEKALVKQLLKPLPRPRGDQTKGGTIIP